MSPRPKKQRPPVPIQLRTTTYERIRAAATRNGEQMSTLLDGILTQWLDAHDKETN